MSALPRTLVGAGGRLIQAGRWQVARRSYASSAREKQGSSSSKSYSPRTILAFQAASGLAAGLTIALYPGWRDSRSTVQCESESDDKLMVDRRGHDVEVLQRKTTVQNTLGDAHDPTRPKEFDDPNHPMRIRMSTWVMELQDRIVRGLEDIEASAAPNSYNSSADAPKFKRDHWLRPQGGEGASCVMHGGRVFEKGGVNVSVVHGVLKPAAIRQMKAEHKTLLNIAEEDKDKSLPFFAAGISIVIHPWNPHTPTIHMNYRYFEVDKPGTVRDGSGSEEPLAWWFGGGSDLTPSYLYPEDATWFHNSIKTRADGFHTAYYPAWKKWADKYFYIPHRAESRGVGGIFFDDLTTESEIHSAPGKRIKGGSSSPLGTWLTNIVPTALAPNTAPANPSPSANEIFDMIKHLSSGFLDSYVPIVKKRMSTPFTEEERRWQLLRRGRYVEFNLVHDRGTKFGLFAPGARIESILMSLPATANWEYMSEMGAPGSGTREEELIKVLKEPRDWA